MSECTLTRFKDIFDKFNNLVMKNSKPKPFTIVRQRATKIDELFLYFTGEYFTYGKIVDDDQCLILYADKRNSVELKKCNIVDCPDMQDFPKFPSAICRQLMYVSEELAQDEEDDNSDRDETYVNPLNPFV